MTFNVAKSPWVVIPTYNERDNIEAIIKALFMLKISGLSILVVDDNSPDGTSQIVKNFQESFPNLHLAQRAEKNGLGKAYVHGFQVAIDQGADAIVQMDADFSHSPADVPRLIAELPNADVVLGSRYYGGISVVNWPLRRLLLSVAANLYAKWVIGMPFNDVTGGFKAWRVDILNKINMASVSADGYGFQIVMTYRAWRRSANIVEVPIVFTERRQGQSKMSRAIVWEAIWLVWRLRIFKK